jgi:hemerythrin-like domain-containing protein
MARAIENLIEEHHQIEKLLASLETFLERLGERPAEERGAIRDYVRCFHDLVDVCHHGKEERFLFVKMGAYGFSKSKGAVSAMLSEQDEGRDHLEALAALSQGNDALDADEMELVRGHALGYIMRIRPHMAREEDILFPIALHSLPAFELSGMAKDFEAFERSGLPSGFHDNLREIRDRLLTAYPPRPASALVG